MALARSRVGRTSQAFTTVALTALVRADAGPWPDRRRHALGESECCICSHRLSPGREAPRVDHQPVEQGPGHSAVPVRDGRPIPEASTSCSTRARLHDSLRPCRTTSRPRLLTSQWPNSTGAPDRSETTRLSITPAHAGTSAARNENRMQRSEPRPFAPVNLQPLSWPHPTNRWERA